MFNNIKYKINDEIINPVVKIEEGFTNSVSSDLRSSSERVVRCECATSYNSVEITNIQNLLSFYKPLNIIGKIIHFPYLIKTIIINIKSLYNGH
jgi:hypothetical protein